MMAGARLIGINTPTHDMGPSDAFYTALLGQELGRSLSNEVEAHHAWASAGVKFQVTVSQWEHDTVACNFAVDDLEAATATVEANGGRLLSGPFDLPIHPATIEAFKQSYSTLQFGNPDDIGTSLGRSAVFMDPAGNRLVLTQLAPFAEVFFDNGQISRHEQLQHQEGLAKRGLF